MNSIEFANNIVYHLNDNKIIIDILLKLYGCNDGYDRFPGPQPKSMEREFFPKFKNKYYVCEKSNGIRYLFLSIYFDILNDGIKRPCCFLINRNKDVYLVKLKLDRKIFNNTILDGELIKSNKTNKWVFLCFDCVIINDTNMNNFPFSKRIEETRKFCNNYNRKEDEPFSFQCKSFIEYKPNMFERYVDEINNNNDFDTDGFIFTPESDSITSGTHENMFKFKNTLDNTVDFEIRHFNNKFSLWLCNKLVNKNFILRNDEIFDRIKACSKQSLIVECKFVEEKHNNIYWMPILIRYDKEYPNSFFTYKKTLKNITENIQIQEFFVVH